MGNRGIGFSVIGSGNLFSFGKGLAENEEQRFYWIKNIEKGAKIIYEYSKGNYLR